LIDGWTIVLDVGKTNVKVSLRDQQGQLRAEAMRGNRSAQSAHGYRALDVAGIDAWLLQALAALADQGPIRRIVPVGHGAAAAILSGGRLYAEPMDYEQHVGAAERQAYAAQRDDFAVSGSPLLPAALNLGLQLHLLEATLGPLPADARILTWPQYWAWRLGGVMASELTSLGCHSDLWQPLAGRFTDLAVRRGWAERMAPLRRADETLSTLAPEVAAATGLPADCGVICGLHDSNAALLAMRGHAETAGRDATVLSTGTWFVAMRSLAPDARFAAADLDAGRDCLINVDPHGRAVPSARFMGGREAELIRGAASAAIDHGEAADALSERLHALLAAGARIFPSFVSGVGPYPDAPGTLEMPGADSRDCRIMTSLYLALMADAALGLIGSQDFLLVEGPFAGDVLFVRALATLRHPQSVFTSDGRHDLPYGALRLIEPRLPPAAGLSPVTPLSFDLGAVADDWRQQARSAARVA